MKKKQKVLNVNDNEAGRYTASVMLRRGGFDVIEATTGAEALALVQQEGPDVVVLDVRLPDIDGFEVCRRIRADARVASTKILCTSATFVTFERRVQGFDNGADGYLTQPFEAAELIAMVRSLARLADAEREMRARAEHLADADRKKDEFLAMLAHELRNPLAAMVTSMPVLERRPPFDAVEARAREALRRQTAHLVRLVDDLLDVSRVTHGKIELRHDLVELNALLERVSSMVKRKIELNLCETIHVRGDATRLEQVFTNLLDNASKYSDGEIAVSLERNGDNARVIVRDEGIGIEPSSLTSVFDLFVQGKVARGGLGIGLTLVRTLVETHGGVVVANSDGPGKGSTFTVDLPIVDAQPATEEKPETRASTRRSVLIIEDNADAQWAMRDLLEAWGHDVKVAGDGGSGVQMARAEKFDIALVDIGLPGIDGYEVARQLRGAGPLLVALTGYARKDEAIAAGFDLHIVKPISASMLEAVLEGTVGPRHNAPVDGRAVLKR